MLLTQLNGQQSLLSGTTAVGGYVGVKLLQEQLRRIAFEFGKPSADPAVYDGTMTLGTIIALANAAPIVGDKLHSGVGQALDVIKLIKAPIGKLPYGTTIINFVLSPWIVDKIFSVILSIIRLVPGGGGAATAMDNGVKAAKTAIANVASAIGTALLAVKKSNGFGDAVPLTDIDFAHGALGEEVRAGYCWIVATPTVPGHWERMRAGQTTCANPAPAGATTPVVRDQRDGSSAPGGVTVTDSSGNVVSVRVGLPPPLPTTSGGFVGIVRDHRTWPAGKEIVSTDWGRTKTYDGIVPFANLAKRDQDTWKSKQNQGPFAGIAVPSSFNFGVSSSQLASLTVRRGAIAFLVFRGFDGARMGAFWDESTQRLKIIVVPEPSSSKYPWDYAADAVKAAAGAVGDAAGAIGGAIADIAQSTWNWISENADDVYNAIKKYGCALVNNDIVVGIAAAGAGIVATPATSAAIVTGAQVGKAACAALEVAEALYAIYQLLSMDLPKPPPLTTPTPPSPTLPTHFAVISTQFLVPATKPVVPLAKPRYPAGSIAAFDPKLHVYRVAIPVGTQLNVLSGALGVAASHFEVETIDHAPSTVAVVPVTTYQKQTNTLPLYKNPIFWIGVGAVAAAAGGGGYVLYRRRRRLTR